MTEPGPELALAHIARQLQRLQKPFALVGGLAVSIRAEVRFTRDVDLAIHVSQDSEVEDLVRELRVCGYEVRALVEHTEMKRLATVRLTSPEGFVVDLLAASSGIEAEVVTRASPVLVDQAGTIPVARAEELLALKVLSMTDRRMQDRLDAINLVLTNMELDLDAVRADLTLIAARGFARDQDLEAKLETVLASARET